MRECIHLAGSATGWFSTSLRLEVHTTHPSYWCRLQVACLLLSGERFVATGIEIDGNDNADVAPFSGVGT